MTVRGPSSVVSVSAEHVRAAAEPRLPELVAQHDDRVAAMSSSGRVGAAERRLNAQRAKDVGRKRSDPGCRAAGR